MKANDAALVLLAQVQTVGAAVTEVWCKMANPVTNAAFDGHPQTITG